MEAGAAFLLLLIVVFVAIVGGGLWLLTSTLRRRKLNPQEDKLDRQMLQDQERPEHHRVGSEQRSRPMPRQ